MSEQEKIENLLKPRYKVIADFPNNHYGVGAILDRDWASYPDDDETKPALWRISQFPHLFQELAWFENREESEMSAIKYVKFVSDYRKGEIYPVQRVALLLKPIGFKVETDVNPLKAEYFLPATELEYTTYISTIKK